MDTRHAGIEVAKSAPASDLQTDQDTIQARLIDLFFHQSIWSIAGGLLVAGLAVLVLWDHAPRAPLLYWLAGVALTLALRGLSLGYHLRVGHARHSLAGWRRIVLSSTALSGLSWGALAWFYPHLDSSPHQTLLLVTLLAVAAGVATLLGGFESAVQLFGLGCLVPLAWVLAMQGDKVHGWLAMCVVLYLGFVMLLLPKRMQRYVQQLHATGLLREGLLMRLEDAESMARVGHFEWDLQGNQVALSNELRRMLGLEPAQACSARDLLRTVAPGDAPRVRALILTALRTRQREFAYEARLHGAMGVMDVSVAHRMAYDLKGRAQRGLTAVQDISERKADQRELQALAFHDSLTGLGNRKLFQDRLNRLVDQAVPEEAGQPPLALLMVDLDHFKTVNDTLGHAMGDRLLVSAAERLRACVRGGDTVARLGGDEFAIIAPELPSGIAAAELAARLNQALIQPFLLDQQEVYVSASIGIALYPEDAVGSDLLLRCADMALFDAKAKGRSGFQFYTPEQTEQARERVTLEADLRKALERHELELHYQAKVDMDGARLVGAEALLRWRHRERGLVQPDRFIRLAEDTGLIVPIGEWVLREACITARAWNLHHRGAQPLKIAVNLSPRQFWAPNLLNMVCDVLVQTGCRPEWIELEITESLLLDSRGQVAEVLLDLRDMGFTLAIDDFGTGYSALGYLTRFPIGTLKIDRSFVNEVASHPEREAIVRAIVSMGHSLKLNLVAEGVETQAQAAVLQGLGCSLAQGWLYGRPMARATFEQVHGLQAQVLAAGLALSASA